MMKYRLVLVDNEIQVADYFTNIITQGLTDEVEVTTCYSATEALEVFQSFRVDILLSDMKMPKMNGLELLDKVKERWPACKVIFLSGVLEFDYVYESIQKYPVHYLTKLEPKEAIIAKVCEVIDEIVQQQQEEQRLIRLEQQVEAFQQRFGAPVKLSISGDPQTEHHHAIALVIDHIQNHIAADLSLVRMADLVHYHPAYLSRLFKECMGTNL